MLPPANSGDRQTLKGTATPAKSRRNHISLRDIIAHPARRFRGAAPRFHTTVNVLLLTTYGLNASAGMVLQSRGGAWIFVRIAKPHVYRFHRRCSYPDAAVAAAGSHRLRAYRSMVE